MMILHVGGGKPKDLASNGSGSKLMPLPRVRVVREVQRELQFGRSV